MSGRKTLRKEVIQNNLKVLLVSDFKETIFNNDATHTVCCIVNRVTLPGLYAKLIILYYIICTVGINIYNFLRYKFVNSVNDNLTCPIFWDKT